MSIEAYLRSKIREVEGFPKEGINFKDITTVLQDGKAFKKTIDEMAKLGKVLSPDIVVGPEARGFVIGAPLAYALNVGFVTARKPGKLPAETIRTEYGLEYGSDVLEIHKDAIKKGQKVLIADDLLATGGTTKATIELIESLGGIVVGILYVMELSFLNGQKQLEGYNIKALIKY